MAKKEIQLTELDGALIKFLRRRTKPISYKELADGTGISVRSLVRCVNRCAKAGILTVKASKDQGPNTYKVLT
jgi:DNA-binding Lrp family transcriptional regulator